MSIVENLSIELVFFLLFGAMLFVSGLTKLREQLRFRKHGGIWEGRVLQSKHVFQKNSTGELIQNYSDLRVEYKENGHKKQVDVKSVQEYAKGDLVMVANGKTAREEVHIYEGQTAPIYMLLLLMITGLLTAMLPVVKRDCGMTGGSLILAAIFMVLGLYFGLTYVNDKRRKLLPLEAQITDLLCWKKGREGGRLVKPKLSYYPIITYERDGRKRQIRSRVNYNSKAACQINSKKTVYYDEENKCITEHCARGYMLFWGIVFLAISLAGFINTFYLLV